MAGKVYMQFDDGSSGWVPKEKVGAATKDGGSVAQNVRMTVDLGSGPIVRSFPGDRVPFMWQSSGRVLAPDEQVSNTPLGSAVGKNLRRAGATAIESVPNFVAATVPGAGPFPAVMRTASMLGLGVPANLAGDLVRGTPMDVQTATTRAGFNAAANLPFELAAGLAPKLAPGWAASTLSPSKSQVQEMRNVAQRQGQTYVQPDFRMAGQQMLAERVAPGQKGLETVQKRNEADTGAIDKLLELADKAGWTTVRSVLARSPEVRALQSEVSREVNPSAARAQINNGLKAFMSERLASRGSAAVPPAPTGLKDRFGNDIMSAGSPGTPRVQGKITASQLKADQRVWRKESQPILRAREQGTASDRIQGTEARLSDALARAAKRELDAIPLTAQDPLGASGEQIGLPGLEARLEKRIPLQDALESYASRVPMSSAERIARLLRGNPGTLRANAALIATEPDFVQKMRLLGMLPGTLQSYGYNALQ